MALLDIDELNLIETYFDEMDLSEEDKEKRVSLCEDLFYIYYYIFALISTNFRLKKTIYAKDYTDDLSERFKSVLNATEYAEILSNEEISDYIDEISENLVKSTLRNLPVDETEESIEKNVIPVNPYWSSTERAIRVAEDMTNVIANYAELEEKKAEGYTHKTWISILDTHTRDSHWLAWGKTVPINKPFTIGSSLMMCPCDHTAPAREIVNCRCKLVYSIKSIELQSSNSDKIRLKYLGQNRGGLTERQKSILNRISNIGDWYEFDTNIEKYDIASISAYTHNEFAVLESKKGTVVYHGDKKDCRFVGELYDRLINKEYKLNYHTHVDGGNLIPSDADRSALIDIGQDKAIIMSPFTLEEVEYSSNLFDIL